MAEDITQTYWDLVLVKGRLIGLDEEHQRKLRSAQLLRSLGSKNDFTKAAAEVGQNIASLKKFILENQHQYSQLGRLPESERDQIEEEIGSFVRACSLNVEKLQSVLRTVPTKSPAKQHVPPSADLLAHRQGMVLILSERLGAITSAFDRLRSIRYRQIQQQQANRRRRTPQSTISTSSRIATSDSTSPLRNLTTASLHTAFNAAASPSSNTSHTEHDSSDISMHQHQLQDHVDVENIALQQELINMTDQVQHAERTVREIATLNQMFSTAILHQSEQIEKLYTEAVSVTGSISAANMQLDKTVKANTSSRKLLFFLLLMASVCLLFVDWWYS